jgi:imidazole glycerol phosphate synthase glutamine amidotransferase subunit
MLTVGVIDYGLSNIFSVVNGLKSLEFNVLSISNVNDLEHDNPHALVLPGVANFASGISALGKLGLGEAVVEWSNSGKPLVGLCLGAQMLFDSSEEAPEQKGLGIIRGEVRSISRRNDSQVAQGWFYIDGRGERRLSLDEYFYFSHSYECLPDDPKAMVIEATNRKGHLANGIVWRDNVLAVQFHPERSGRAGLDFMSSAINGLVAL